jgi:hypothetical protein
MLETIVGLVWTASIVYATVGVAFGIMGSTWEKFPQVVFLGKSAFVGELVDTKCFLGVMRPATGKIALRRSLPERRRASALLVRDEQSLGTAVLLAASNDKPFSIDPELAARTLQVHGSLELHSGLPILRVHSWHLAQ